MNAATTERNLTTEGGPHLLPPEEIGRMVKGFRTRKGWTQETLAELSGLQTRTIQRVEQGQPSSIDTRRAIGRAFKFDDIDFFNRRKGNPSDPAMGVTGDDLEGDTRSLETLWWISDPMSEEPAMGSTFCGLGGVMYEIEKFWKVQSRRFIDTAPIFGSLTTTKNKVLLEFSQKEHERTSSITLRSCSFLAETGLIWRDIDDLDREYFLPSIRRFIFRTAHIVTIDGMRFPPDGAEPCYRVEIYRTTIETNTVKHFKGTKHFDTQREFYWSLGQWLGDYESEKVKYRENRDGIVVDVPKSLSAKSPSQLFDEILIQVGWIDAGGHFQVGPLPISDRQYFIDSNSRLLQWLGDSVHDGPIPPFEPELKLVSQVKLRHET